MGTIYCRQCGALLEDDQEVLELDDDLFCDMDCVYNFIENKVNITTPKEWWGED